MTTLRGSKTARFVCDECGAKGEPFRVYLFEEDGQRMFNGPSNLPWNLGDFDNVEMAENGDILISCPGCYE